MRRALWGHECKKAKNAAIPISSGHIPVASVHASVYNKRVWQMHWSLERPFVQDAEVCTRRKLQHCRLVESMVAHLRIN